MKVSTGIISEVPSTLPETLNRWLFSSMRSSMAYAKPNPAQSSSSLVSRV
jgi:hypothetical protein